MVTLLGDAGGAFAGQMPVCVPYSINLARSSVTGDPVLKTGIQFWE
jgi:hypothetical protein